MKINIVTCRPKDHPFPILSWAIRFFQKTDYSHFAIQFGNMVLDATGKDVRLSNSIEFYTRYKVSNKYEIEIDSDYESFSSWCSLFLNRSYGYFQIIGLLLMIMGLFKKNPFGRGIERLICNELVILLLKDFKDLKVEDSDDFDLVQTETIVKEFI